MNDAMACIVFISVHGYMLPLNMNNYQSDREQ